MTKKRDNKEIGCEHELYSEDEFWIDGFEVEVIMKCSLCDSKFKGRLKLI